MDNESITDEPAPLWPEMSSDITSARTVARSITLDTQRASTDGRVLELSSQLQAINARLLELETRIATGHAPDITVDDGRTAQLEEEVGQLRSLIAQTSARLDDQPAPTVTTTDAAPGGEALLSLDGRMAAVESGRVRDSEEVNQLMSYLEQAFRRLDELSERLATNEEGLRTQVGEAEAQLAAQVGEVRGVLEQQVSDVETNLAADVAEARQQLDQQVQQAEERLNEALAGMDQGASSETTDALDERINELHARVDEASNTDALDERINELHARVDEASNTDALDERVNDLNARVDNSHSRIDEAEQRATDASGALAERLDSVESKLGDLDDLSERADGLNAMVDERTDAAELRLADRIQEARELLAGQQQESSDELSSRLEASEQAMVAQVAAIEEDLVAQVTEARALLTAQAEDNSTNEAVEALEERVTALDELANNATSIAIESQHFSENLRVLQTDLVKAIQVELEGQAVRLSELESTSTSAQDTQGSNLRELEDRVVAAEAGSGNTDARLEHLETTIVSMTAKSTDDLGLAPANPLDTQRLIALEGRLDEATASIDGLADLQHRATNLDSSLAESMTNMTAALEQNNLEIQTLRSQLDEAHARIASLEGDAAAAPALTFSTRERPDDSDQPVPDAEPRGEDLRVADVIGETTKEERLTPKDGSDWFVASYAKKDKGRGRFRRP